MVLGRKLNRRGGQEKRGGKGGVAPSMAKISKAVRERAMPKRRKKPIWFGKVLGRHSRANQRQNAECRAIPLGQNGFARREIFLVAGAARQKIGARDLGFFPAMQDFSPPPDLTVICPTGMLIPTP
jgi:hypothetical protein